MADIDTNGAKVIGVKITPKYFERWFRSGKIIDRCLEGIPAEYKLKTYGFDINEDSFFLIFATDDALEGVAPTWVNPACRTISVDEIISKTKEMLGEGWS